MVRMLLGVVAAVAALVAACGTSSSSPETVVVSDPATPVGSCEPNASAKGNSLHVGAYCAPGNSQCDAYENASLRCSIDLDPRGGNFCILLGCHAHADCGEQACCTGDPGNPFHACVPLTCVADAGVCPPIP